MVVASGLSQQQSNEQLSLEGIQAKIDLSEIGKEGAIASLMQSQSGEWKYTINGWDLAVEKVSSGWQPTLLSGGELSWSGKIFECPWEARYDAIKAYHGQSGDLKANASRIISIDPDLLAPHPRNTVLPWEVSRGKNAEINTIYEWQENHILKLIRLFAGENPTIDPYNIKEDGTITSGNSRNVAIQVLNLLALQQTGHKLIQQIPAIVRSYSSVVDEMDAIARSNQYRDEKSFMSRLKEAKIILAAFSEKALANKSLVRTQGYVEENVSSMEDTARVTGVGKTTLRNALSVDAWIEEVKEKDEGLASKLTKVLTEKSPNTAYQLQEAATQDSLSAEVLNLACDKILATPKGKLSAERAIQNAQTELHIKKTAEKLEQQQKQSSSEVRTQPAIADTDTEVKTEAESENDIDWAQKEAKELGLTETQQTTWLEATEAQREAARKEVVELNFSKVQKVEWYGVPESQRETWRIAREAIARGDDPNNNRLTPVAVIESCLETICKKQFDVDVFADATLPNYIPSKKQFTILNPATPDSEIEGDVFANIPWNEQAKSIGLLVKAIESGKVNTMFLITQSTGLQLGSTQKLIKKHGFAVLLWEGRLEFAPGNILTYSCKFAKDGTSKDAPTNGQRYETCILFYSKNLQDKFKFQKVFEQDGMVLFQKDVVNAIASQQENSITKPVWIGNECLWEGWKLRVHNNEGFFDAYATQPGKEEKLLESFDRFEEAQAYAMSQVLVTQMR